MSEQGIREHHNKLEVMRSSQSVTIVNEVKSQAHKDRGELLDLIASLKMELLAEKERSDFMRSFIEDMDEEFEVVGNGTNHLSQG